MGLAIAPFSTVNRSCFFFLLVCKKNCIVFCWCPNFSGVMQPRSDVNICMKPRSGLAKIVNICLAKIFQFHLVTLYFYS